MRGQGHAHWVSRLSRSDVPVQAVIVKQLLDLTHDSETSVAELAEVILKDANFTSQVIKVANSVSYNPHGLKITTVSRAIVLLGFDQIRSICVSLAIVDVLLKGNVRQRLLDCLAKCFHSAAQAKCLCPHDNDHEREKAFIGGLLFRLGELAFWSTPAEEVDQLDQLLATGADLRQSTHSVLGTSFRKLSVALVQAWKLGDDLLGALTNSSELASKAINLGVEVAEYAPLGWDSSDLSKVVKQVADFSQISEREALERSKRAAETAVGIADTFGVSRIAHLIPGSVHFTAQINAQSAPISPLSPDPKLQLDILRELTASLKDLDLNSVFQMVLEGLHRGVGLERVIICFVQAGSIKARYLVGEEGNRWREALQFSTSDEDNLLHYAARIGSAEYIKKPDSREYRRFYSRAFCRVLGKHPALVASVKIQGRVVAVVYADRASRGAISADQQEGFRHFIQQTELCLQVLSRS